MKWPAHWRCCIPVICLLINACTNTGARSGESSTRHADFHRLTFHTVAGKTGQSEVQAGSRRFVLLDPDDPTSPKRWQGPLRIENPSGKSCEANLSIITDVYASEPGDLALVESYSGSITSVDLISSDSCQKKSPTIKAVTEEVRVQGNQIQILPGCECTGGPNPCDCSAAQVYSLGADFKPVLDEEASKQLTRSVLGVEFLGRQKVFAPKTPAAKLAEP